MKVGSSGVTSCLYRRNTGGLGAGSVEDAYTSLLTIIIEIEFIASASGTPPLLT